MELFVFSVPARAKEPPWLRRISSSKYETNKVDREIVTTLDLARQHLIERRVSDYVAANSSRGIENASALLVDAQSMNVLAQIGSANFWDKNRRSSRRHPQSALTRFNAKAVRIWSRH